MQSAVSPDDRSFGISMTFSASTFSASSTMVKVTAILLIVLFVPL